MNDGIGLQSPRGSGTSGLETKGFEGDHGTGDVKKANREILEHDRKREIELKLVILEDKLIEQEYTEDEIAEKLEELRKSLEAADAIDRGGASILMDNK